MNTVQKISDAEWSIMKQLWERHPRTAQEIASNLASERDWRLSTVKTLLSRLVTKKAVGHTKQGREFYYFPLISEAEGVRQESASFLNRVFGGALHPMLATLLENESISEAELKELRKLLDAKTISSRSNS